MFLDPPFWNSVKMDFNSNFEDLPTPASVCTPISVIKTKRLRPVVKDAETQVVVQLFTPSASQGKENTWISTKKSLISPGVFISKSFHTTGFTPKSLKTPVSQEKNNI